MLPRSVRFDPLLVTEASVLAAGGDLDVILRAIVDQSLGIMPRAEGAIVEMQDSDDLIYRAASGRAAVHIGRRLTAGRTFAGRSLRALQPMMCADIEEDQDVDLSPYRDAGMRALISVPLVLRREPVGVLKFYSSTAGAFLASDFTIAQLIASQIMAAMDFVASAGTAPQMSPAHLDVVTEAVPMLLWTMTPDGLLTYCNRKARDIVGSGAEAVGRNALRLVVPAHRKRVARQWMAALAEGEYRVLECPLQGPRGQAIWLLVHLVPLRHQAGAVAEWIGAAAEITYYKTRQAQQRDALREGEAQLHKVNHRVQNSLQIVVSLITLQANRLAEGWPRKRLLETRAQVSTIAQVFRAMQSGDYEHIEFMAFLDNLLRSLNRASSKAHVVLEGPPSLALPVDRAVPTALLIEEMFSNAVKHGGLDPASLSVRVSVAQDQDQIRIDIADNGRGLPTCFDPERSTGLGFDMMLGLAEQADGRIEIIPAQAGAHFRVVLAAR